MVGIEQAEDEGTFALSHKIQDMINNYQELKIPTVEDYDHD
jgi:hypothetical protein